MIVCDMPQPALRRVSTMPTPRATAPPNAPAHNQTKHVRKEERWNVRKRNGRCADGSDRIGLEEPPICAEATAAVAGRSPSVVRYRSFATRACPVLSMHRPQRIDDRARELSIALRVCAVSRAETNGIGRVAPRCTVALLFPAATGFRLVLLPLTERHPDICSPRILLRRVLSEVLFMFVVVVVEDARRVGQILLGNGGDDRASRGGRGRGGGHGWSGEGREGVG